jgi:uncharacterized protein
MKTYRKAGEQGNASAEYKLGEMHYFGQGVPQNDAEAMKWLRKAAEQGTADAQDLLGFMYDLGLGGSCIASANG